MADVVGGNAKAIAEATYDAASDRFDSPQLAFWDRTGRATVSRLAVRRGESVLDLGCGTGASVIPAAEAVGPTGRVVGIDISEAMLTAARAKAAMRGLLQTEFYKRDMCATGYDDGEFDVVISVFSIFFVPDMAGLAAEFWRMVRPGGRLAVITWGPDFFQPVYGRWKEAVRMVRRDLHTAFNPWDRISTPEALRLLLERGGIPPDAITVESDSAVQKLVVPEDWWTIVLGSGLRWTVEQMGPAADQVRRDNLDWIGNKRVTEIKVNTICGIAKKRAITG